MSETREILNIGLKVILVFILKLKIEVLENRIKIELIKVSKFLYIEIFFEIVKISEMWGLLTTLPVVVERVQLPPWVLVHI